MYPYNRNDDIITKASKSDKNTEKNAVQRLSNDKQLLSLLETAAEDTENTGAIYEILSRNEKLGKDGNVLRSAFLDQIKHSKELQEIYYQITGINNAHDRCPLTAERLPMPKDLGQALEALFLDELENVDFYRDLLLLMPQGLLWDTVFEIMNDKQDHCHRLCYLYSKYK